jgi:Uma2 family endonuclease
MITFVNEIGQVQVPPGLVDLSSFRRWIEREDFPDQQRICFLRGEVWVDMSKEQVFTHVAVKTEYTIKLGGLARGGRLGRYFGDGLFLTNVAADISVKPDGTFVSRRSLSLGRVRLVEGSLEGFVELDGSPDMVLEVISTSSVHKDMEILRQSYWEAGIREYWLVDARADPVYFAILRHRPDGYQEAPKQRGWVRSAVFRKSFRLRVSRDRQGHPDFTLAVR